MTSRDVYLETGPNGGDVRAFGRRTERGTIIVDEGARARYDETEAVPSHTQELRRRLIIEGIWVPVHEMWYRQVRDYEFETLSSAACALRGSSVDGHRAWKFLSNGEPVG